MIITLWLLMYCYLLLFLWLCTYAICQLNLNQPTKSDCAKSTHLYYFYNNYVASITTTAQKKLEIGLRSSKTSISSMYVVNQFLIIPLYDEVVHVILILAHVHWAFGYVLKTVYDRSGTRVVLTIGREPKVELVIIKFYFVLNISFSKNVIVNPS